MSTLNTHVKQPNISLPGKIGHWSSTT